MANGIYRIRNTINDNCYVGSTFRGFSKRKKEHITNLISNKHHSRHLQNAWNKENNIRDGLDMSLSTLPNKGISPVTVRLRTPYAGACPVSGYPLPGSWIEVEYTAGDVILELSAVAQHLPTYADEARDVETVAQLLARDIAAALGVPVIVRAYYKLRDGIELWVSS